MEKSKLLIVDDDFLIREMLADILSGNYSVETAENGDAARVRLSKSADIDLVISDLNMPAISGMDLLRALRAAGNDTPFIMLTGTNEASVAMQAINSGADDYLLKDENLQSFMAAAVERVFEKKRLIAQNRQLLTDVNKLNQELAGVIYKLTEIGIALGSERDYPLLLDAVVTTARDLTHADGGTLYLLRDNALHFKIVQNGSMGVYMGGNAKKPIPFPPVELKESNVSAYVALHKKTINIPDVYKSELFDFSGPKKYDSGTGYRSKSMLVLPMMNHEGDVIGVLQLLNAIDPVSRKVAPFPQEAEKFAFSIASQAAVAISNTALINDLETLFISFAESMATAIDEKSPVTGGHIRRMTNLTMELAEAVNEQKAGRFKDFVFKDHEMHVLRIAAWMHDIGKITTPVEIIEKGKKLENIIDRIQLIDLRLRHASKLAEIAVLKKRVELPADGPLPADGSLPAAGASAEEIRKLEEESARQRAEFDDIRKFLRQCNEPGEFLGDDKLARLKAIRQMSFTDEEGNTQHYLTDNELENLSIRRGSITEKERQKMQDHAALTIKMLQKIPFTKRLKEIPRFAGLHHEFINGTGYPLGLKGDEIPFESRLMAVTDIAEALTAADRPYKKAMPIETVYKILRSMAKESQLDPDLVELFITGNIYQRYKARYEE